MENYENLAIRTENIDFAGIAERLQANLDKVLPALNTAILALQQLDYVVKKEVFYGKSPKYYEAPLFQKQGPLTDQQKQFLQSQSFLRLLHAFMGVGTEAGEGLEALAKAFSAGEQLDMVNIGEEAGDVFWYLALVVNECGTSFSAEQYKNIRKLAARHGEKFSDTKVMERDLAKERAILQN